MSFAKHPEHSEGHLQPGGLLMIIEQEPIKAKSDQFPMPQGGRVQRGLGSTFRLFTKNVLYTFVYTLSGVYLKDLYIHKTHYLGHQVGHEYHQ